MTDLQARFGDRTLFPSLAPRVYLNHAAISPPSVAVQRAVNALLDDYARRGVEAFGTWMEQRNRLRTRLATLIGARPEDLGFTLSTTRGLTDLALCIPWKRGDRLVLFRGEFPANVTPWQRAAELFGLEIVMHDAEDFASTSGDGLARLEAALKEGVRLVAVSAVQFQTGLRMPLAEMGRLCRAHGAELCVDAVQAVGAVPLDVQAAQIDYLACGAHKWLMSLEGSGFIYVHPDRIGALRPVVAGWTSHEDGLSFLSRGAGHLRYDRPIRSRADFVETGNVNAAGFAALEASVTLIQQLGVEAIFAHVNRINDRLEEGLLERGFTSLRAPFADGRSCTLSVLPPDSVDVIALHRGLGERGISCTIPDGRLRFSPHWPNRLEEVEVVLEAVDALIR